MEIRGARYLFWGGRGEPGLLQNGFYMPYSGLASVDADSPIPRAARLCGTGKWGRVREDAIRIGQPVIFQVEVWGFVLCRQAWRTDSSIFLGVQDWAAWIKAAKMAREKALWS